MESEEEEKKRKDLEVGPDRIETGSLLLTEKQRIERGNTVLNVMLTKSKRRKHDLPQRTEIARKRRKRRKAGKGQFQERIKKQIQVKPKIYQNRKTDPHQRISLHNPKPKYESQE